MYTNIFDSHAHYTDSAFDGDRNELLTSLSEVGICAVVNCGSDIESSKKSIGLSKEFPFIYSACGIHPEEIHGIPENYVDIIKDLAKDKKCVAIGEIGLDYYWRKDDKDLQKEAFINQIKLANELSLPVIIHDRDAHGDTLEIIREYKPKGVVHCFSGSKETAEEIIKLGMYIGVGGALTFKNARKAVETVSEIPLERILLETDCPYMSPVPMRGKRNYSGYIPYVAEKLAEIKNTDPQTVLNKTAASAKELFGIG